MKKGSNIEVLIEKMEFPSKGYRFCEGLKVYAKNSFPGQKVLGRVYKKKKDYAEIRLMR